MTMNLRNYRKKKALTGADICKALKPVYPKVAPPTITMAEQPEKYGVQLTDKAEQLIQQQYGPAEDAQETKTFIAKITLIKEAQDNEDL